MQVHVPWINTHSRVTTGEPAIPSKKKKSECKNCPVWLVSVGKLTQFLQAVETASSYRILSEDVQKSTLFGVA